MKLNTIIALSFITTLMGAPGCSRKKINKREITEHDINAQQVYQACFDSHPNGKQTSYVYSPGLKCTEVMMGRFCPIFTASTGEKVTWRKGVHVIGQPHSCAIFAEINLYKKDGFSINPFAGMLRKIREDMYPLSKRCFEDQFKATVEEIEEEPKSVINYSLNLSKANMGQYWDMKRLDRIYRKHMRMYPEHDIVLYGDSRGAVTIFNLIATEKKLDNIKAVVMEAMFDSITHMIKHMIYIDKDIKAEKRLLQIFKLVIGGYKNDSINPRKSVETVPLEIPILMITSLKDGVCEPQTVFWLYNRLRERGHQKIHLLVLEKAYHPQYTIDNEADTQAYEQTVHAFYKHYHLSHNAKLAAAGAERFKQTQPTAQELQDKYQLPQCSYCKQKTARSKIVTEKK